MTIACIDVGYRELPSGKTSALAAAVVIKHWTDASPRSERTVVVPEVQDYQSGKFFRRELPCVLAVLESLSEPPKTIVIDGYVAFDDADHFGLGKYVFESLGGDVAVVGVAKNPHREATSAIEVHRGHSQRPLYVTAVGINANLAAKKVQFMHGKNRLPTILKRADRLSRGDPQTQT